MTIPDFLAKCASTVYAEPRSGAHDHITDQMAPLMERRLPAHARVLDVGCGQGPALEYFTAAGFTVLGITLSALDAAECLKRGLDAAVMDQNAMPDQWTGTFDGVWARHVLEHSPIPFFTLHEFARVLKPGGVLYVEMPLPDTACQHQTNSNHFSVLTTGAWQSLIHRAGFDIDESRTINLQTFLGPDAYVNFFCTKTKLINS